MTTTDLMREYLACARSGDWERGYAFYADDVRFHIPGRSGYAGERSGRDAARAYIEHARALSGEHEVEVELVDLLASETRVALRSTRCSARRPLAAITDSTGPRGPGTPPWSA